MFTFHKDGTSPTGDEVFVFGSNLAGQHAGGAALVAVKRFGAKEGVGVGFWGQSYAIPTIDRRMVVLPIEGNTGIRKFVEEFITFAAVTPERRFFVTRIGCGIAGYQDSEIAPLFVGAPDNCSFAEEWKSFFC